MARGRYNEQEPELYEDQFGDFYYDPNTGEFVSVPATSGIGAPAPTYYEPAPAPTYYEPAPAPEPVYVAPPTPEPAPVSGIGTPTATYYAPEPEPVPISGLGNPNVTPAAASFATESARYSPETLAAYNEQQKYLADFVARTGYESELDKQYQSVARRATTDDYASSSGGDRMAEMYENPTIALSEDVLAERLSSAPPVEQRITSYFTPQTNDQESAGRLSAKYNTPFRLYDGSKLVYEGVGPEAAAEAAALATAISKEKGAEANWQVMQQAGDKWITTANDAPDFSVMDAALKYGLPLAVSFIPGLNVLATMAAAGAASTAGNLLAGESLKNSLISGALSAATAGVFKGLTPGGAGAAAGAGAEGAAGAAGAAAGVGSAATSQALTDAVRAAAGEIVVTASRGVLPGLLSGTASALTGAGLADLGKSLLAPKPEPLSPQLETPELQTPQAVQAATSNELPGITVTGSTGSAFPSSTLISGITAPALQAAADQVIAERQAAEQRTAEEEMVVTGSRVPEFTLTPPISIPTPDLRGITQALPVIEAPPVEPPPTADEEIVVTGSRVPEFTLTPPISIPTPDLRGITQALPVIEAPPVEPPPTADEEMVVTGSRIPPSVITAPPIAFNPTPDLRGITQALPVIEAPPVEPPPTADKEIVVTGSTGSAFPSSTLISGITAPALSEVAKLIAAEQQALEQKGKEEEETVVTASRLPPSVITAPAIAPPVLQPLTQQPMPDLQPAVKEEPIIEVRGERIPASVADLAATAIPFVPLLPLVAQPVPQINKPGPSVSDAIKIADLAATGIGAVADAVGGGGDDGGGVINTGSGYTVPKYARTRSRFDDDPFSYGQRGGELLFFDEGVEPGMAEGGEVDDDMVNHLIAYRKGGGHAGPGPVKGIGSGQEDKIPAWLSDGEYVWSAQDVADLGDGSTDEGVRRLDRMRQMVRRGAGRKNVKKIAKPQRGIQEMLKAVGGAV